MFTGFIQDPTPESFVMMDEKGEKTMVVRSDVKEICESSLSLMPEGLIDDLDNQSLLDFFAYLTSKDGKGRASEIRVCRRGSGPYRVLSGGRGL